MEPASTTPRQRLLLAGGVLATLLCARTPGFFHIDEYMQVVEPASHLLGRTAFAELCWEFPVRMRPWLQPALYALLGRGAEGAGVEDPFALLLLFRLASAAISWAAILSAWRALAPGLRDDGLRTRLAASLAFAWFVPFLAVRTSSEALSGALLVLGLAPRLREPDLRGWEAWASALALGLSVQARFQTGFAVVGVAAHALLAAPAGRRLRALAPLAVAGLATTALGAAVDGWAYGEPAFAAWNYLRINVLEGAAAVFGTSPAPAYLWLLAGAFPPFGVLLLVALVLLWLRKPRHVLTFATLPFAVAHTLVGHKESRFLFPILLPAMLGLFVMWDDPAAAEPGRGVRVLAWLRRAWVHPLVLGLAALGLALACTLPSTDNVELQRFVRSHERDAVRWCGTHDPWKVHALPAPFVRTSAPLVTRVATDLEELQGCAGQAAAGDGAPVLAVVKLPGPPGVVAWLDAHGTRVFSAFPRWIEWLDFSGWVSRSDFHAVYRLPAPR